MLFAKVAVLGWTGGDSRSVNNFNASACAIETVVLGIETVVLIIETGRACIETLFFVIEQFRKLLPKRLQLLLKR